MDVTASVASHHFSDTVYRTLERFEVSETKVSGSIDPFPYSFEESGFFYTAKTKVMAHLSKTHGTFRPRPDLFYLFRVLLTFFTFFVSWAYCCFQPFHIVPCFLALLCRAVLIGIGHEAIHGRYAPGLWHLFDAMIQFPSDRWHYEHCILHHPHTKVKGVDPDEELPPLRLSPHSAWQWFPHRIQVFMQLLLQGPLMSPGTCLEHHIIGSFEPHPVCGRSKTAVFGFGCFCLQMLPICTHPEGWATGLLVVAIVVFFSNSAGLHGFHISHIVEQCAGFEEPPAGTDWGEHQLLTSCNWATGWYSVTGMLDLHTQTVSVC